MREARLRQVVRAGATRIVFGKEGLAVQLERIFKRADVQHEFGNGFAQGTRRFHGCFVTHVVGVFFLQYRVARLQNFGGCLPRAHLLDPNGLLTQALFFFRHRREGNLDLLYRLTGELPLAFFAKINRCRLDRLPHRGLLRHTGTLAKVLAGDVHKAKHFIRRAFPQKIQIHLRGQFIHLHGQLRRRIVQSRLQQHVFGFNFLGG